MKFFVHFLNRLYNLQKIFEPIQFWFFVWWKSSFSLPCTLIWKLISVMMVRNSNPSTMIMLFWQLGNNTYISNYLCWIMCRIKPDAEGLTKCKDLSQFLLFICSGDSSWIPFGYLKKKTEVKVSPTWAGITFLKIPALCRGKISTLKMPSNYSRKTNPCLYIIVLFSFYKFL
jgi:hypothetical protein